MIRSLYHILYIAVFAWAIDACSESADLATTPANDKVVKINVSPYPAFAEDAGTRSVGTFDAGKTIWEAGDEIMLMVNYYYGNTHYQYITLTYNDIEWNADKNINWLTTYTMASAVYAPDWTFDMENVGSFTLKEDVQNYGTSEFLKVGGNVTGDNVLSIDFSNATRNYSRLRIAGEASATVNVTFTNFRPSGKYEFVDYEYSLTTDEIGNAYLYGSWEAGATLTIKGNFDVDGTDKEITLFNKTISTASDYNNGYVADARPSYKNEGNGTAENPYRICLPQQFASLAEAVNSGAFAEVDGGIHVALENDIDLSGYPDWMPIGNTDHPFMGVFDGQEHTISNNNSDNELILFGIVQESSTINVQVGENIKLKATEP